MPHRCPGLVSQDGAVSQVKRDRSNGTPGVSDLPGVFADTTVLGYWDVFIKRSVRPGLSLASPIGSVSVVEIQLAEQRLAQAGSSIVVEGLLRPMSALSTGCDQR